MLMPIVEVARDADALVQFLQGMSMLRDKGGRGHGSLGTELAGDAKSHCGAGRGHQ